MNEQSHNNTNGQVELQNRLDAVLESCRHEDFDNSRIKSLVRAKIMLDGMQRARRRRRVVNIWGSVAACVVLAVTVVVNFLSPKPIDLSESTLAQVEAAGYNELVVAAGKRMEIRLSDGSRLVANSHSRVLYPERFTGDERHIFASGEVYLEVAKDASHPFVVESDGFEVKVLGTTFNICNTSDSTAQVVLVEGAVEVTTDCDNMVRLTPNDMVSLVNGEVTSLTKVDTSDYTMWINGLLSLHGEPLSRLVGRLSEHYGIDISCDPALGDVKMYGKLDLHDSIDQVLTAIGEIVPMKIEKQGGLITMKSN